MALNRSGRLTVLIAGILCAAAAPAQQPPPIGMAAVTLAEQPYRFDTAEQHAIRVEVVARGLAHPFGFTFLPTGDALVTERGRRLRLVRAAARAGSVAQLVAEPVAGLPDFGTERGAGVLDVVAHPDFARNGFVYITYNRAGTRDPAAAANAPAPLALGVARARFDGSALTDFRELLTGEMRPGGSGSRLAFGPDDTLYVTTGATAGRYPQELGNVYGKVLRIKADGSIPADNPFVGRAGARPEVFSYGHRDQLGITLHPVTGQPMAVEHGPNGGDEVNMILPGRNYGWPDFSYGRAYEGPRISVVPVGPDTEPPLLVWLPSIAPSGVIVYSGDRFPAWRGNLFTGSARRGGVPRTGGLERVVFDDRLQEMRRETLLTDLHQRIRDVRQGPDGLIYVITDEDDGALLRISPTP